jgi:hypothetical protein
MIATSPDGQWAAMRRGRALYLLAGGSAPATAQIALASDDADLIFVGPPNVLVAVTRGAGADQLTLYQPPLLDAVAKIDLEQPMRIAAITGPRLALLAQGGKAATFVRVAGRGLSSQAIEPGSPVEFAAGLERNQFVLGLHKKFEAWDAVSGRPLLRMQLALPPAPRVVGQAHGHVWAFQPRTAEIVVCRMSDGRPFRHVIGAAIDDVICHPSSPLLIVVTARGLVRLHCFAHSLTVIDAPWRPGVPLAQLVAGEDIFLLGDDGGDEPWRVAIGGASAPAIVVEPSDAPHEPPIAPLPDKPRPREAPVSIAADKLRAMRERTMPSLSGVRVAAATPPAPLPVVTVPPAHAYDAGDVGLPRSVHPTSHTWRDALVAYASELLRGGDAELPPAAAESELAQLAHRLDLAASARHALTALYAAYLVGEPALAIARLAYAVGEWVEPLGQGELAGLALLRRRAGKVSLRAAVTDALDGAPPRAIRLVGTAATARVPAGVLRVARAGRTDTAIEAALATQLGGLAVIEGPRALARGVVEARLHGVPALAFAAPATPPEPWPDGATLLVVIDDDARAPAWLRALAELTAA